MRFQRQRPPVYAGNSFFILFPKSLAPLFLGNSEAMLWIMFTVHKWNRTGKDRHVRRHLVPTDSERRLLGVGGVQFDSRILLSSEGFAHCFRARSSSYASPSNNWAERSGRQPFRENCDLLKSSYWQVRQINSLSPSRTG